jgi:cytoskeletal protein RodZ
MDETSPESTNTTTPPAAPASSSSPTIKMNTIFLVALVAAGIVVLVNWVIKFAKDKMEQKSSSSTSAPSTTPAKSSESSSSTPTEASPQQK